MEGEVYLIRADRGDLHEDFSTGAWDDLKSVAEV
jgi:hypothetical protein